MMNFFRLRVINTLLFFLIGTLIGFVLKERFFPRTAQPQQARYQPEYSAQQEAEQPAAEPEPEPEPEPAEEAPAGAKPQRREERTAARPPERDAEKSDPVVIETSVIPAETPEAAAPQVVKGSQDDFFSAPAEYIGKDLEMELQMITARRSTRGWRLNFVYTGPDKKIDYLYVDDTDILGEKPDLRIGYVYRIRFHCSKGEPDSGNTLTLLTPTGDKAAWATGLSALE